QLPRESVRQTHDGYDRFARPKRFGGVDKMEAWLCRRRHLQALSSCITAAHALSQREKSSTTSRVTQTALRSPGAAGAGVQSTASLWRCSSTGNGVRSEVLSTLIFLRRNFPGLSLQEYFCGCNRCASGDSSESGPFRRRFRTERRIFSESVVGKSAYVPGGNRFNSGTHGVRGHISHPCRGCIRATNATLVRAERGASQSPSAEMMARRSAATCSHWLA